MLALVALTLGTVLVLSSIVLLFIRPERAESKIQLFGQSLEIPAPSLVVMLAGVGLVALPFAFPERSRWDQPDRLMDKLFASEQDTGSAGDYLARVEKQGDPPFIKERESNDSFRRAKKVPMNTVIQGSVNADDSSDWFVLTNSELKNIRMFGRVRAGRSFKVVVYDRNENQKKWDVVADRKSTILPILDKYYVLVRGNTNTASSYEIEFRVEN